MSTPVQRQALKAPTTLTISSSGFQQGRQVPREHTGFGDDTSPPLAFEGIPDGTQALAIVVDDPDAPGGTFTHWTIWNIPAPTREVPAGAKLAEDGAIEGRNDFGSAGYRGPKPPSGTHRYFFRVFALDAPLQLKPGASVGEVWKALSQHTLAWGELMGTFTKP